MLAVRAVAAVLFAVMAVAITVGLTTASFGAEGRALLDLTWGVVTLVDIYAAFTFAWLWIAWREGTPGRAVIWLVLVVTLGSLAIAGYVGMAAWRSSTVEELLLGPDRA